MTGYKQTVNPDSKTRSNCISLQNHHTDTHNSEFDPAHLMHAWRSNQTQNTTVNTSNQQKSFIFSKIKKQG